MSVENEYEAALLSCCRDFQGLEVYVCFPVQVMVDDTEDGQLWPGHSF